MCFVSIVLPSGALRAQGPLISSVNLEDKIGKAHSYDYRDVITDNKGYTWLISAGSSIQKTDGSGYLILPGIGRGVSIWTRLFKDQNGRIWIMEHRNGLAFIENDKVIPYEHNDEIRSIVSGSRIQSLDYDNEGTLHLGIRKGGYYTVSKKGSVKREKPLEDEINGWIYHELPSGNGVFASSFNNEKTLRENNLSLYFSSYRSDSVVSIDLDIPEDTKSGLDRGQISAQIIRTSKTEFLFKAGDSSVIQIRNQSVHNVYHAPCDIVEMFLDSRKGLWISGFEGGLYHYPKGIVSKANLRTYYDDDNQENYALIRNEDHEGGIWMVRGNEVKIFPEHRLQCYSSSSGHLDKDLVLSMATDGKHFFSSSFRGDLNILDITSNKKITPPKVFSGVHSLTYHKPTQSLWYGAKNHFGFGKVNSDGTLGPIESYSDKVLGTCLNIEYSDQGLFCIQTNRQFILWKGSEVVFNSGTFDFQLSDVHFLSNTELLVAGQGSLLLYKLTETGGVEHFLLDSLDIKSIDEYFNKIWLVSADFELFQYENEECTKTELSVSPMFIQKPFRHKESLWIHTKNGFAEITNPQSQGVLDIKEYPFWIEYASELTDIEVLRDTLFFANGHGILKCAMTDLRYEYELPKVTIENIMINGRDTSILNKFDLRHDQNAFQIEYATIRYRYPEPVTYEYLIEGSKQGWTKTDNKTVVLGNQPPGLHNLKLRAQVGALNLGPTTTIAFNIAPPYWQTWWFRAIIAIIIIGLVWLLATYRLRMRQRQTQLELDSHIANQKALRAQINPHFVFNVISGVQYLVNKSPSKASHLLGHFASLIRKALDHSFVQWISLESEIEQLEQYIKLEQMRMDGRFEYDFELKGLKDLDQIAVPPALIQPYVENAIWHGLKGKEEKGHLALVFQSIGSDLNITISDNGPGRQQAQQASKKGHKSYGMLISAQRIQLLNDDGEGSAKVEIEDLKDKEQCPVGTRVSITFKLRPFNESINN